MSTLYEMLSKEEYNNIWKKYCGFLDLSMKEFMQIQERLLMEQIELLCKCELGQKLMGKETKPTTIDEFRESVPLTTYEDYADILLNKKEEALPSKPLYWIQTTWKGGTHDIKLAPYSESMIQEHTKAFLASLILATSKKKGEFSLRANDKFLYGMAPLPYLTGLAPYGVKNEIDFEYLPSIEEAEYLSFEERNKVGFQLAINKGIDLFFGLSSVLVKIGEDFARGSGTNNGKVKPSNLKMVYKLLKAYYKRKFKNQTILPKDLWEIKGILCAGTDTHAFKDKIEYYWGKRPLEIYGGTEIATVATETGGDSGLTFFPDVNFLEFIPERDSLRSLQDRSYVPKTLLLNEIKPGERYEIVTTKYRGGVFVRYRVGDLIECLSLKNEAYNINLPQIRFVDRISNIIDLAGFTRITKSTIDNALGSEDGLISNWVACKEYEECEPKLHLYIECKETEPDSESIKNTINDKLKAFDSDYRDLHTMLGMDPLKVTVLSKGIFEEYKNRYNEELIRMNPNKKSIERLRSLEKSS